MKTNLTKEMREIAERLGWKIEEDNDTVIFSQYSPAGEDFSFTVRNDESLVERVQEYSDYFDPDEHASELIEAARHGLSGVPYARELVRDADAIEEMLIELSDALHGITPRKKKTNTGFSEERLVQIAQNLIDWIVTETEDRDAVADLEAAGLDSDELDALGYHRYAKLMRDGFAPDDGDEEIDLLAVANEIASTLINASFNNSADSSEYYTIRHISNSADRYVNVYKSIGKGTEKPHYIVYCSYEDGQSNYAETDDLSVEALLAVLNTFAKEDYSHE